MKIKRNERGNIEFTPEEFADFLCEISYGITSKLNAELVKHITIEEATNAIIKDLSYIEPKLYEEASKNFNPFLYDKPIFRNGTLLIKGKITP